MTRSSTPDPMTDPMNRPARRRPPYLLVGGVLLALAILVSPVTRVLAGPADVGHGAAPSTAATPAKQPPVHLHAASKRTAFFPNAKHVFVINIENKGYDETWGPASKAPYLSKTLRRKGVLLNSYYGTAHNSESNYVAQISGQGPNIDMQADCQTYNDFVKTGMAGMGQLRGTGCVFPTSTPSLPIQLTQAHLTWKGYMDDMKGDCEHPVVGHKDGTQAATKTAEYATRHDPFAYFHAIIDNDTYCKRHVVPLTTLPHDLRKVSTTPNLTYITPDLCNDGHDAPCADGRAGGLTSVNVWMKTWVPRILHSKAFKKDGVLVITADESDGPQEDSSACCNERAVNTPQAGIAGAGGGVIGALVISRWTRPGTWSSTPYNHYSLLATMENIFHVRHIGFARMPSLDSFGLDVFNNGWNERHPKAKHHHKKHGKKQPTKKHHSKRG